MASAASFNRCMGLFLTVPTLLVLVQFSVVRHQIDVEVSRSEQRELGLAAWRAVHRLLEPLQAARLSAISTRRRQPPSDLNAGLTELSMLIGRQHDAFGLSPMVANIAGAVTELAAPAGDRPSDTRVRLYGELVDDVVALEQHVFDRAGLGDGAGPGAGGATLRLLPLLSEFRERLLATRAEASAQTGAGSTAGNGAILPDRAAGLLAREILRALRIRATPEPAMQVHLTRFTAALDAGFARPVRQLPQALPELQVQLLIDDAGKLLEAIERGAFAQTERELRAWRSYRVGYESVNYAVVGLLVLVAMLLARRQRARASRGVGMRHARRAGSPSDGVAMRKRIEALIAELHCAATRSAVRVQAAMAGARAPDRAPDDVFDHFPDLVCLLDNEVRFTYLNRACGVFTGIPTSALRGRRGWSATGVDEQTALWREGVLAVFQHGRVSIEQLVIEGVAGARHFEACLAPVIGGLEKKVSVLAVLRDVTERVHAQESALGVLARLEAGLEALPVGVLMVEGDVLVHANSAARRALDWPTDSAALRRQMLADAAVIDDLTGTAGTVLQSELISSRRGGQTVALEVSAARVFASGGRASGLAATVSDVTQGRGGATSIRMHGNFDVLTGLANRARFTQQLQHLVADAMAAGAAVALILVDLDRFKRVNDSFGHRFGDQLLRGVAATIEKVCQSAKLIARMGGDEFAIVVDDVALRRPLCETAEELVAALSCPFDFEGIVCYPSVSIGISTLPGDAGNADDLVRFAELAMHGRKGEGGDGYRHFSLVQHAETRERLRLETDLRLALDDSTQLLVYFQPKAALGTGEIVGFEALVRWQHPALGLVMPDRFIPIAEETGLIVKLGQIVLRRALEQARQWQACGYPCAMAVNLSMRQFQDPMLAERVRLALAAAGVAPQLLEFEITESILMGDADHAKRVLNDLHDLGVAISIDDFGTGYSSLSYLKALPIDAIKIDRSFIAEVPHNQDDVAITQAIIELGHRLGLTIVAEGVECAGQLDFLRQHGCDFYQGYLLSRPLAPEAMGAFLSANVTPRGLTVVQASC